MDGYEWRDSCAAQAGPRPLVLIAVTGYAQDEARHKAMEAGFDHFIVKPVAPEELKRLLDAAAGRVPQEPATR